MIHFLALFCKLFNAGFGRRANANFYKTSSTSKSVSVPWKLTRKGCESQKCDSPQFFEWGTKFSWQIQLAWCNVYHLSYFLELLLITEMVFIFCASKKKETPGLSANKPM